MSEKLKHKIIETNLFGKIINHWNHNKYLLAMSSKHTKMKVWLSMGNISIKMGNKRSSTILIYWLSLYKTWTYLFDYRREFHINQGCPNCGLHEIPSICGSNPSQCMLHIQSGNSSPCGRSHCKSVVSVINDYNM